MRIILSVLLVIIQSSVCARTCWFPDGTEDKRPGNIRPCADSTDATCCPTGYACLSNNLCEYTNSKWVPGDAIRENQFIRSSCTDKTFTNPACASFCTTEKNAKIKGQGMKQCPENKNRFYCKNSETDKISTREQLCSNSQYYIDFPGRPNSVTCFV